MYCNFYLKPGSESEIRIGFDPYLQKSMDPDPDSINTDQNRCLLH
jgi:hypothetical protein